MIDDLDDEVKTYLAAVGAIAIYVATVAGVPIRAGFTHDPLKTKTLLARRWPSVVIGWLAWVDEKNAAEFCAELVGSNLMARSIGITLTEIERMAYAHKVTLTPHARAVERAKDCSERLNWAFVELQTSGALAAFNHAYRVYRENQRANGESALPYWAARQDLRRLVIGYLAAHDELEPDTLLADIRKRFPWFRSDRPHTKLNRKYQGR